MGLSSSKTRQTNEPSAYSKPYISAGAGALRDAYGQVQPLASSISSTLGAQLPSLASKAFTPGPGLTAATGYNTNVLNGVYMGQGNPYLGQMLDSTADDVTSRVQAAFGASGRTGSGANAFALSKGLASAENGLRYADYDAERQRMAQAAGLAPTLDGAQYQGLGAYLQAAQGAVGIPQSAAAAYSGGVGSLLGSYNSSTSTTNPSLGLVLAQIASNAARSYPGAGS